jgi:hypothetical protein
VAEVVPTIEAPRQWLAQAEAYLYHKEFVNAGIAAYEAAAAAARVPLYQRLVDPFTADEALWEFENLFVLSGLTGGAWADLSSDFQKLKSVAHANDELASRAIVEKARRFVSHCAELNISNTKTSGVSA